MLVGGFKTQEKKTLNCWKIEVKSSRAVLSYQIFEDSMTVYEGQVFLVETCHSPERLRGFEKQISGRFELEQGVHQACPTTVLIVKHWKNLCSILFTHVILGAEATFPLHRKTPTELEIGHRDCFQLTQVKWKKDSAKVTDDCPNSLFIFFWPLFTGLQMSTRTCVGNLPAALWQFSKSNHRTSSTFTLWCKTHTP